MADTVPADAAGSDVKSALIVAGIGGSGASTLAKVLSRLNAAGENPHLVEYGDPRPAGRLVSSPIGAATASFLRSMQQGCTSLHSFPEGWMESPSAASYMESLREIVRKHAGGSKAIVLGHPCFCRVLPLVARAVTDCGYLAKAVLCFHHPYAVSMHVRQHSGLPSEMGLAMWLRYALDSERHSRGMRRCVVDFAEFAGDWMGGLRTIGQALDVAWAEDPMLLSHEISDMLDAEGPSREGMERFPHVHLGLGSMYSALRRFSRHPYAQSAMDRVDTVARQYDSEDNFLLGILRHMQDVDTGAPSRGPSQPQAVGPIRPGGRDAAALGDAFAGDVSDLSQELAAVRAERRLFAAGYQEEVDSYFTACVKSRREVARLRDELAWLKNVYAEQCAKAAPAPPETAACEPGPERAEGFQGDLDEKRIRRWFDSMVLHRVHERQAAKTGAWRTARFHRQTFERILRGCRANALGAMLSRPLELSADEIQAARLVRDSGLFDPEHYHRELSRLGLSPPAELLAHFVRFGMLLGIDASPYFDSAFYARTNKDVDFLGVGPFLHFITVGAFEGRSPNQLFDASYYNEVRRDVRDSSLNPLVHYLGWGAAEGQNPSPLLDHSFYVSRYGSDMDAARNPLAHYLSGGRHLLRQPNLLFDPQYYLSNHPEAGETGVRALEHYVAVGEALGYKPHPLFDPAYYAATNGDVPDSGFGALVHFLRYGMAEGRAPNPLFDVRYYLSENPEAASHPGGFLAHYLECGSRQSRSPHPDFDLAYYRDAYPDLGESGVELLGHFLDYGDFEGRRPNPGFDPLKLREAHSGVAEADAAPFRYFLRQREAAIPSCGGSGCDADTFFRLPWVYDGAPREKRSGAHTVLFVSHVADRTGAPLCLLRLLEQLACREDLDCRVVLHEGGELARHFSRAAPTLCVADLAADGGRQGIIDMLAQAYRKAVENGAAVVNTAAGVSYAKAFMRHGVPVLSWLHELPTSIDTYLGGAATVERIKAASRGIVCPSYFVRDALVKRYGLDAGAFTVLHNGTELPPQGLDRDRLRSEIRQELGLPEGCRVVLGCGTLDMRKGADLFVRTAQRLAGLSEADARFVWVGDPYDKGFFGWLKHDVERLGVAGKVIFAGPQEEPSRFFAAADVFVLTSREDPFPMVSMEALSHGLPVVAFEGAGGAGEIAEGQVVRTVPYCDTEAMARAVDQLLGDLPEVRRLGRDTAAMIASGHSWRNYADEFLKLLRGTFGWDR